MYYSKYKNKSKTLYYKPPKNIKNKSQVIRGVYDIETNNEKGKFIIGGLALNNGFNSDDIKENYNIYIVNKPSLILQYIYQDNKERGFKNRYEIAVHNLLFDSLSLLYNIIEYDKIKYSEPSEYGKQALNTYSIIMNNKKQIYSMNINYCGVSIMFWDTLKLFPTSLKNLGEIYNLKYKKINIEENVYNCDSYEDYIKDEINLDYLTNDLLSLAELVDKDIYKLKTSSGNGWENLRESICNNLDINKKNDTEISKVIEFWGDNELNTIMLAGYNGGYCYLNPKYIEKELYKILHLDINSSYPNSMHKLNFPIKYNISSKIESNEYVIYLKGTFILKENKIPTIKNPRKLNSYLDIYKGELLLTYIDFERIKKNYEIKYLKIIEVYNFIESLPLMKDFVELNYHHKTNSTGFMKLKAKLNLNSSYGKLAENHNGQYYEAYIEENKLKFKISNKTLHLISTEKSRNVIWAMLITAYSREKLFKVIDIIGDDFIYCDTDSIFTKLSIDEFKLKLDSINEKIDNKELGCWNIEGISPVFKAIRSKCYIMTDNNILTQVVAGYNGKELTYNQNGKNIKDIPKCLGRLIFNNFKIGRVVKDKHTSKTMEYGIKQVKVLSNFEIKKDIDILEYLKEL